jgi:hypothetical protein
VTQFCLVYRAVFFALLDSTLYIRSHKVRAAVTGLVLAALFCTGADTAAAQSKTATSTTLVITSGGNAVSSVATGAVVTLSAQVKAAGAAITPGLVNFCDASATTCTDIHLLGTAQLTSAGTATMKLRPGIGSHSYKAVFAGTNAYAGSASATTALTVTGTIPQLATATAINQNGSWGAYTLKATVTEVGNTSGPTGTISFLDTNHANAVLGAGTLGSATRGVSWAEVQTSAPDLAGVTYAVADLNGDGIADLFVEDYFGTYNVLLGNGDGTFTQKGAAFGPASSTGSWILGDFNNDGIPDVAAIEASPFDSNTSITIFLGNGDGTFTTAATSPVLGYNPTAIASADINGDGNADLIVMQQGSTTSSNGEVVILFGAGDGTFTQASSTTSVASVANSIIPADINRDGNVDLVLAGSWTNGITILLGKGDGTFRSVAGPSEAGAANAAVADVNNDGFADLVFPSASGSFLTVFLGNGDGTFTSAPSGTNADLKVGSSIVVADINQDGIPDIVESDGNVTAALFGKGDGTFVPSPGTVNFQTDGFGTDFVVADSNGDGWPDLLSIELSGRTISVALTQPTATATASATVSISEAGTHLAEASYPGDSNYDASTSGTVALWGVPPGTSTTLKLTAGGKTVTSVAPGTVVTLTATVKAGTSAVAAGQVNFCDASAALCSDMHLLGSAALSSSGTAVFKFVPGTGTHSYKAVFLENGYGLSSSSSAVSLTVGPAPAIAYTDTATISEDGQTGDYSLTATIIGYGGSAPPTGKVSFVDTSFGNASLGTATLGAATAGTGWRIVQTSTTTSHPKSEVPGDFNGDGILDVAVLWSPDIYGDSYSFTVFTGNGDGTFLAGQTYPLGLSTLIQPYMTAGDFNADGKTDLAFLTMNISGNNTNSVTVFLGTGNGTFGAGITSAAMVQKNEGGDVISGSMTTADFNGDGKMDLAVTGACVDPCGATILLGHGDGSFTATTYFPDQSVGRVVAGDFNEDGIPDLAGGGYFNSGALVVLSGKGDGSFAVQPSTTTVDSFPSSIVTGDFNSDGAIDLAFGYSSSVDVLLGKGDGTFTRANGSPFAGEGQDLVAGDFNHDGKADLVGLDPYSHLIDLLTGDGHGGFALAPTTPAFSTGYSSSFHIVGADFNGDGVPDLALLDLSQSGISTLLTEPTETATATLTGVAPVGAGNHDVKASYPGDSNYPAVQSGTVTLYAGLKPLVITPAGGTFSSVQTVTITEGIPGATIYYQAYGVLNTNGFVQYTGPISLNIGGKETIIAYATENGYYQSSYTTVTFMLNLPVAPAPVISPAGGVFASTQTVTITDSAAGSTVYYTTDGTVPTTNSTIYSGPIYVSTSETVAAIAGAGGYGASPSASAQFFIQSSQSRFIYTVAGNGFWGVSGNGGPAAAATLNDPTNTATDAAGNLYIADSGNQMVRRVDAKTGTITRFAGTGTAGYKGDGGAATSAQLNYPYALAFDSAGNLYISDSNNYAVRRVDEATGTISTVAGTGTSGYSGDGGQAGKAELAYPQGIAVDKAGNLYIGDQQRVRVVNASTGVITTFAGNGSWGFSGDGGPATSASLTYVEGLAIDQSGNLYIADADNAAVRKVTAATGIITTVAGQGGYSHWGYSGDGGPATSAMLNFPQGVAVDGSGNLYIADSSNYVIREVTAADGIIKTIAGHRNWCTTLSGDGGPAVESGICYASGVAIDSHGNLYVAEEGFGRIRQITPPIAPPSKTTATPVLDVAAGTYGDSQTLHISDATAGAQIFINVNGSSPATPTGQGYFGPIGITGSSTINAVAVAPGYLPSNAVSAAYTITTPPTALIHTVAGNGTTALSGTGGPAASTGLGYLNGIASDGAGNVYVVDQPNYVVWLVSASTGKISVAAGIPGVSNYKFSSGIASSTALGNPQRVAVDKAGDLFISDTEYQAVLEVDATTGMMTVYAGGGQYSSSLGDGGPATQAYVSPNGLAFDRAGNLYIADGNDGRIREVSTATGIITTVAGGGTGGLGDGGPATSAGLNYPGEIVFDSMGNLYIGDQSGRVRVVDATTGIISTFAGNGNRGATGDGGPAKSAELYITGLAVDSKDNLYIANSSYGIRMVPAGGGIINRVVGVGYVGFGGDGGAASMAEFCGISDLTFDKAGSIFIADACNYRVRKVSYPGATTPLPVFSPAAGTYTGAQTVTISDAMTGAAIYYTTDASTPTTGSTLYNGPIAVSSSETVKAIAVASGYAVSVVASADYVITQKVAPAITWATPAPIAYGAALSSAQLNATTTVAGSFLYSPAAGTVLNPGQQTLAATFTPTDTATYLTASASVMLTVNKAAPVVSAVQSSLSPAAPGNAVTFTVNVTSTVGSPSGTVIFNDGTTQLGTATLSSGSAGYSTSALAAGSHPITAVYSGDDKFASATSAVLTQLIETISIGSSSGSSSTATVAPGGQATYSLAVTPPAAGDPLTFSVTGLPAGATGTFSPSSLAAGAGATNVTLSVTVPSSAAVQQNESLFGRGTWPLALGLLLLPFARRSRKAGRRWLAVVILAAAGLTTGLGLSACGGGSSKQTPPPQTYTLTVTATSGTLTQSTNLTLVVQQ